MDGVSDVVGYRHYPGKEVLYNEEIVEVVKRGTKKGLQMFTIRIPSSNEEREVCWIDLSEVDKDGEG